MTPAGIEPATFRFVAQHLNYSETAIRSSPEPEELCPKAHKLLYKVDLNIIFPSTSRLQK